MKEQIRLPKIYLDFLDQIFEMEKKVELLSEGTTLTRNINRLKEMFEHLEDDGGLIYYNPIGEQYNETRTDIEASIAGDSTENLIITEVIKPIIRYKKGGTSLIARRGVVIVESKVN